VDESIETRKETKRALGSRSLKVILRGRTLPSGARERIPGFILCTTIALLVSLKELLDPGYVSAGDLVPPYDLARYFTSLTSPWNHAYSFGNVGASSGSLFSLPLYVFHYVFGLNVYLADKLWIFFFYWLSGIVFYEVATIVFSRSDRTPFGLPRLVATAAFMLSPITITDIVVPTLVVSTPAVILALIELRRLFLGKGIWSYAKFFFGVTLSAFYYPSVFFTIIFSAVIALYMLIRMHSPSLWLRRTTSLLTIAIPLNFYWLFPLGLSFFGQGSLYGTSQVPQSNVNELYTNWSAQFGWTALGVVSSTRTVFTPSLGYALAPITVIVSGLITLMFAGFALVISAPSHKRLAQLLSIVLVFLLYLGIRDHPIIDSLAFLLSAMLNSGLPLRVELWNLFKQPSIILSFLPEVEGLLVGIAFYGILSRVPGVSDGPPESSIKTRTPLSQGGMLSSLDYRVRFWLRRLRPTMLILLALIPLTTTGVYYSLELSKAFNPAPIPAEFIGLNSYFDANPTAGRLLFLPPRSYGGFLYGWWPKSGYTWYTWPLYAATPPSALLDSSTPDSANLLLYLYIQGIVKQQTHSIGPMLSTMGGSYVAYSSDFITSGLDVSPGRIVDILSLQQGLSAVYNEGSIHLFRVTEHSPQVYAADSSGLVVGSFATMLDMYAYGYNATRSPIVMAYQLNGNSFASLLGLSDYIMLGDGESLDSLVLLMNSDKFLLPTSFSQQPSWSNVAEGSLLWVFNGPTNNVTGDLLYGKAASASSIPGSVLSVGTNTQDSEYDVWMRLARGPGGGYVNVDLDGAEISTIQTNQTNWSFDWVRLPSKHLAQGHHTVEVTNGAGLNVINVIALLPQSQYQSSRQTLVGALSSKNVYMVSRQGPRMLDPKTNATQSLGQFDIPSSTATVTYEMKGQGHYTATIESTKRVFLILTEYFDSTFDSKPSALHFPAQYVMNGYVMEPNGKQTIELQYKTAGIVEASRIISLSAGVVFITSVSVISFKARRQKSLELKKDET
jgi:hypothetical protein